MDPKVRKWLVITLSGLVVLALLPFALIAKARVTRSPHTQWHVFLDMDFQPKYGAQQANPLFVDGRAMRPPVPGTIARGELHENTWLYRGVVDGKWATEFPMQITHSVLERGRERFGIYCAPCHGLAGYGDGIVAKRAERLEEGTWVPPSSYHTDLVRSRPVGHIFNTVTNGIRNMPGYGSQVDVPDRWAIVAYVRALQLSQHSDIANVPDDLRREFK